MVSPFVYGHTVSTKSFTNREDEVKKLQSNLVSGINTTIISPRRWGKSSLVERVVADLQRSNKNIAIIKLDLFAFTNAEEFLEAFAREAVKASTSKWQDWVNVSARFFNKLLPRVSVGVDPHTDFSISFELKELKKHSDEVLNLPETIAIKNKIKVIVCLDEFQQLSSFKDSEAFEKRMRAVWQKQKSVTYCLYGSKRHMMTDIFNNPSRAFYRFGDIMMLPKIGKQKWVKFITTSFAQSGKQIDVTTAEMIPDKMKNHSWYVQQLAHYTWNLTTKKAGANEIGSALTELIQANSPLYQSELEKLSPTQVNLLKAILKGETKFTSVDVMQTYQLSTPRNVSRNKQVLIDNDIAQQTEDGMELLDPAFEIWLRKIFFNEPYL